MNAPMSPEVFAAGANAALDDTLVDVHEWLSKAPPDTVLTGVGAWLLRRVDAGDVEVGQLAGLTATALVRLADEQAAHAKTCDNFEAYAESTAEELARLRAEIDRLRAVAS